MRKLLVGLLVVFILIGCGEKNPVEEPAFSQLTVPAIIYNNEEFTVKIDGKDIIKAELFLNDKSVANILSEPFSTKIKLVDTPVGKQTFVVFVEYGSGKKEKKTADFTFKVKEGTEYQGGIIVFLDSSGERGIIAAKEDLTEGSIGGIYFFDFNYGREGVAYAAYDENDGSKNTKLIPVKNEPDMAAYAANKYRGGGFSDWYIPAINEFEYLKKYDKLLGLDLSSRLYWSSTLQDATHAKIYCFGRCSYGLSEMELNKYHWLRVLRRF